MQTTEMKTVLIYLFLLAPQLQIAVNTQKCPSGDKIIAWGMNTQQKKAVIDEHNKFRRAIMDGKVIGQPKGKNILMMTFDDVLGQKGRNVSGSCKMKHIIPTDDRWRHVGQNLYISWSSENSCEQNWVEAVGNWFAEHTIFKYPKRSKRTGHYTQLVWHDSSKLGCDFICFYDHSKPKYPYVKLYTCNYGPGGNINKLPPYDLA